MSLFKSKNKEQVKEHIEVTDLLDDFEYEQEVDEIEKEIEAIDKKIDNIRSKKESRD